jgi:hypothetical protein
MAGFHYRFSVNVGAWIGNKLAKTIVHSQLRRRGWEPAQHDPTHP